VGKKLILTAAHCLVNDKGEFVKGDYRFHLGMIKGKALASSTVNHAWWGGTKFPTIISRANDWALLRLDNPLGKRFGYFGTIGVSGSKLYGDREALYLAGYGTLTSSDTLHFPTVSCEARESFAFGGGFYHDCDSSRGDSGGPMYSCSGQDCWIYGINVAEFRQGKKVSLKVSEYSSRHANLAVAGKQFVNTLVKVLKDNN
jgi:protease YdgD